MSKGRSFATSSAKCGVSPKVVFSVVASCCIQARTVPLLARSPLQKKTAWVDSSQGVIYPDGTKTVESNESFSVMNSPDGHTSDTFFQNKRERLRKALASLSATRRNILSGLTVTDTAVLCHVVCKNILYLLQCSVIPFFSCPLASPRVSSSEVTGKEGEARSAGTRRRVIY